MKNENSATQLAGSAIVHVCSGGRKKKLKHAVAAIELTRPTVRPLKIEIARTTMRYAKPTVVAFASTAIATNVTTPTRARDAASLSARRTWEMLPLSDDN